jgi:hypothetical protein
MPRKGMSKCFKTHCWRQRGGREVAVPPPKSADEPQKTVVVEHSHGFTATFSTKGTLGPGVEQRGECFLPALLPF